MSVALAAITPNFASQDATMPAQQAFEITPTDTTAFASPARAIYVGGAGNIALITFAGTSITFNGLLTGSILPVGAQRINSTNTTATNLVGLI